MFTDRDSKVFTQVTAIKEHVSTHNYKEFEGTNSKEGVKKRWINYVVYDVQPEPHLPA
jgi:hypothetical protein